MAVDTYSHTPAELEKGAVQLDESSSQNNITPPPEKHDYVHATTQEATVTLKTCLVIFVLSSTFGLSFWPVPTTAAMQAHLAAQWGSVTSQYWYIPAFTTACALGFLLCGTNSDLFGRRMFLIFGNAVCTLGFIVAATANGPNQFTAAMAVTGFGAGFCQMAMCAIPELMPNKYRHIGITISDGFVFVIVVIGPVVGRYAIDAGKNSWKYIFAGGAIAQTFSLVAIALFYFPPKHPKGVPWREGLRGLDYTGAFLMVSGGCLALVGIINTTYMKSSSVLVVAPMCVGFGLITLFGFWETFSSTKYKLCPPEIFRSHRGREFTAPFILAFIVTMFYYAINIIYPTMINVFYITPTTSRSETLLLTLPGNLGLVFGSMILIAFGNLLGHWRWTLIISWSGMTLFGGLMALVTPHNKGLMIAFTFIEQSFFGFAQYESVAFTQLGVHQHDLGTSGGLAGFARFAGGSLAQAIYSSILTNVQAKRAAATVPRAAIAAGLPASSAAQLLAALPLGAAAVQAVPGVSAEAAAAAGAAFAWSYAHALRVTALASLSFGGVGLLCCFYCENIDAKMNDDINVFLENDVNAERNEFH